MLKRPNRLLIVFVLLVFLFSLFTVFSFSEKKESNLNLSAKSYILFEPSSGKTLLCKNESKRLPMASTTKIMTAYLAVLSPEIEKTFSVSKTATGIEGSSLYLKEGETFSLLELTYALMLRSANDAAVAIAEAVSGSLSEFVSQMNIKALELGLSDTHFDNPNGLDSETHYTTAKDLAILTAAALQNPLFAKIVSTKKTVIGEGESKRLLVNHNRLLNTYEGCLGVKTGYTKKDGRCLVSFAERDGVSLIAVTLNAPNDWNDHKNLFDYGFSLLENRCVVAPKEYTYSLPVLSGSCDKVTVTNKEGFSEVVEKTDSNVEIQVSVSHFITAPIKCGDVLGYVTVKRDGIVLASLPLLAEEDIEYQTHKRK